MGKRCRSKYFTEVVGGVAEASETADTDVGTLPARRPGETVGTSYLVFVDEFFIEPRDRDRVLDSLMQQLPNLQREDRMAIVAYDGKKVDMLANWTSDVTALTRVVRRAKARDTRGLARMAEERAFESRREFDRISGEVTDGRTLPRFDDGVDLEEERYAETISSYVQGAVRAATATLRGFAGPTGRKVMLLYSGGWPNDPGRWVVSDFTIASRLANDVRGGRNLLAPLWQTANRLGYTIYPVDAPGIDNVGIDASDSSFEDANLRDELRRVREEQEELSLLALAAETGGQALLNNARTAAFERVVSDTRSYYWLGFTPSWQGDDTEHRVEVRVADRRGAKVRTRESYSDLSRQTEVSMMVESALLFGDAPGATPLEVVLGEGKRAGWGKRSVPIEIRIPVGELTFLPASRGWVTQLELRVAVLDQTNAVADIPVIPFGFQAEEPPAANDWTVYRTELVMRNRAHDLIVSLYDVASGKILASRLEVPER
ncbi:MAG: VWA domain-containing protein [Acidobacteriota bacterium]